MNIAAAAGNPPSLRNETAWTSFPRQQSTSRLLHRLGGLGFLLRLIQAQRQLHRDQEELLTKRLDGVEKERDEALATLRYVGHGEQPHSLLPPHGRAVPTGAVLVKKRLFISTPVRGFDNDEFTDFVEQVSRMIDGMNATRRFEGIFYENYRIPNKEIFESRRLSIKEYFAELERADVFVAIVPISSLSSVYFEAGYAVALDKRSMYFIPEGAGKVMPSLMNEAHRLRSTVTIVQFDSLDHVQRILTEEFGC